MAGKQLATEITDFASTGVRSRPPKLARGRLGPLNAFQLAAWCGRALFHRPTGAQLIRPGNREAIRQVRRAPLGSNVVERGCVDAIGALRPSSPGVRVPLRTNQAYAQPADLLDAGRTPRRFLRGLAPGAAMDDPARRRRGGSRAALSRADRQAWTCSITNTSLVRYDAYEGAGGHQSASISTPRREPHRSHRQRRSRAATAHDHVGAARSAASRTSPSHRRSVAGSGRGRRWPARPLPNGELNRIASRELLVVSRLARDGVDLDRERRLLIERRCSPRPSLERGRRLPRCPSRSAEPSCAT